MSALDRIAERSSRRLARHTSRRSFLATLGRMLTGAVLAPLLPIDRSSRALAHVAASTVVRTSQDEKSCDYWRYCAVDGYLCSCCGGSTHSCPPGTSASTIMWIGTCHNPADGRDYVVSYNDCCGKTSCGNCPCNRNEGEKPMYRPARNNDLNWCLANAESNYHCTVSVIVGVAEK